jgi:hypothetical protein
MLDCLVTIAPPMPSASPIIECLDYVRVYQDKLKSGHVRDIGLSALGPLRHPANSGHFSTNELLAAFRKTSDSIVKGSMYNFM